jgi:hypothetical protein
MKHIHTFESFLNENLNEAKMDLGLSTFDNPSGVVARYRIDSTKINLKKLINLSRDSWSKNARAFDDNEIGFESAGERRTALAAIQKSFDSGQSDIREFSLNESVNEAIEIVYYSEVLDNWGRTESSEKPDVIAKVLQTPDEWTDDMMFQDKGGKKYDIDELIGKQVKVGSKTFTIKESVMFNEETEE